MLSAKYRFHSRGGVKYTYRNGKNIRTAKVSLIYNQNSKNKQRFAVVISKKVLKSAVKRNRVRRRIYEVIRHKLKDFTRNYDCIFVIYSADYLTMSSKDLYNSISYLLDQISISK